MSSKREGKRLSVLKAEISVGLLFSGAAGSSLGSVEIYRNWSGFTL